jgi:hypothetical protein
VGAYVWPAFVGANELGTVLGVEVGLKEGP